VAGGHLMLSIVWPQNIIKTFIESVGAIAEECKITFKQDGLVANVIDPAHVCFIGVEIPSEKFDSYEVEGNVVIPIELSKLTSILKISQKKPIKMVWGDGKTSAGMIRFEVGGIIREATLLQADAIKSVDMPSISPPIQVRLKAEEYNLGVSAVSDVGNIMKISFEDGKPIVRSDSHGDTVELTFMDDVKVIEGSDEDASTKISVEYMKRVCKGLGDSVKVSMGNNSPLRLESANQGCSLTWMVAPPITDD